MIDASFTLVQIAPGKLPDSRALLQEYDGFNVTIPYKVDIIPLLNDVDRTDEIYGSVNTVKNEDGFLTGYNTDAYGFTEALRIYDIPQDGSFILYGAGGAARAAAVSILQMGGKLTIAARNIEKATEMAEDIRDHLIERELRSRLFVTKRAREKAEAAFPPIEVVPYSHIGTSDTIINATPAGMSPANLDICVVPDEVIASCSYVFDMVYNPYETLLVGKAKAMGKKARSGMAMLVFQAVAAIDIWVDLEDRFDEDMIKGLIRKMESMV
jgi:shikimate dehydrogenase